MTGGRSCAARPHPGSLAESDWSLSEPSLQLPVPARGARHPLLCDPTSTCGQWRKGSRYWAANKASQALSQGLPPPRYFFLLWVYDLYCDDLNPHGGGGSAHGLNNSPLVPQEGSGGSWVWTREICLLILCSKNLPGNMQEANVQSSFVTCSSYLLQIRSGNSFQEEKGVVICTK